MGNTGKLQSFRPWLLLAGARPAWPDPNDAEPDEGLVAVGGDLAPMRLLSAYAAGIFPWFDDGAPILWWSPEPRAVLTLDHLHVSRSLRRTLQSGRFHVQIDHRFAQVLDGCADRPEGTWITEDMKRAYTMLHRMGYAHSFEVYRSDNLVGGLYGVQVGGAFAAESMFHRATDASKVALVCAVTSLFSAGFSLFDVQFETPHLRSMGATVIQRREYLAQLQSVRSATIDWALVCEQLRTNFPALITSPTPI